jgi:hypothetical protein
LFLQPHRTQPHSLVPSLTVHTSSSSNPLLLLQFHCMLAPTPPSSSHYPHLILPKSMSFPHHHCLHLTVLTADTSSFLTLLLLPHHLHLPISNVAVITSLPLILLPQYIYTLLSSPHYPHLTILTSLSSPHYPHLTILTSLSSPHYPHLYVLI